MFGFMNYKARGGDWHIPTIPKTTNSTHNSCYIYARSLPQMNPNKANNQYYYLYYKYHGLHE